MRRVTVTVVRAVTAAPLPEFPPLLPPVALAVMRALPGARARTMPLLSTVATSGASLRHVMLAPVSNEPAASRASATSEAC